MTTLQSSDYYVIVLIPSHITENKYFKNNLSNTAKSSKYCYYQVSFLTYIPTYFETHSLVFFCQCDSWWWRWWCWWGWWWWWRMRTRYFEVKSLGMFGTNGEIISLNLKMYLSQLPNAFVQIAERQSSTISLNSHSHSQRQKYLLSLFPSHDQ